MGTNYRTSHERSNHPVQNWYNEGEKNTKYFLTLEKRHFKQGTISQLKANDKDFITTDEEILTECKSFYEQLYTSRKNECRSSIDFFPPDKIK